MKGLIPQISYNPWSWFYIRVRVLTRPTKERQLQKLAISRYQFHVLALLLISDGRQDSSSELSLITLSFSLV